MATKVGEGYVEIETRIDNSNFVRMAADVAARGGKAFESEWAKATQRIIRDNDQQFTTHINKQISSFQALEKQRVSAAQDSQRRLSTIYSDIAKSAEADRRISDSYAREGERAARAFETEQTRSFDRVANAYKSGFARIEADRARTAEKMTVDIDRDSHNWGRAISTNVGRAFEAVMSLMPARLEGIFTNSGPVIGTALFAGLAAAVAVAGPALGAMFTGLFAASLGIGAVIGAVFVGIADDPRVAAAATRIKDTFFNKIVYAPEMQNIGAALAAQLDKVNAALGRWAPSINSILQAGAKFMGPLTDGFVGMIDAFLPALDRLTNSPFMSDLMHIVANGLVKIGEAFGISFDRLLQDPQAMEGAKKGLEDFFNLIAGGIKLIFDFTRWLSSMWEALNGDPDGAGSNVSKLQQIRDFWKDIRDDTNDTLRVLGAIVGFIDRMANVSENLSGDLGDINAIWDALHGRGVAQPPMGTGNLPYGGMGQSGNAVDNNGDAEGQGGTNWWSNQWADIQAESSMAWAKIQQGWDVALTWLKNRWNQAWADIKQHAADWWGNIFAFFQGWINNIQNWWNNALNFVKSVWNAAWGGIKDFFVGIWQGIFNFLVGVWEGIVSFLQGVWNKFWSIFGEGLTLIFEIWRAGWQIIIAIVLIAWAGITTGIKAAIGLIGLIISSVLDFIKAIWNAAWGFIKDVAIAVWNAIWGFIAPIIARIAAFISATINLISSVWNAVWGGIKDFVVSIWNTVWNFLSAGLNIFVGFWVSVWNNVSGFFSDIWNTIWGTIQGAWNVIWSFINTGLNALSLAWNTIWAGMHNVLGGIWSGIVSAVVGGINAVIGVLNSGIRLINSVLEKLNISFRISEIGTVGGVPMGTGFLPYGALGQGRAGGGRIYGGGTETSDSILTPTSKNEYIVNARSAKRIGYGALAFINKYGAFPGGMAAGGRVGGGNNSLLEAHRDHVHVAMNVPPMGFGQIIRKAVESGLPFGVTSTFRPGSRGSSGGPDHHSTGKAVDFGGYNQDAFASFWEKTSGVIELIHRTASRDYAIFGGSGGSFLNEWLAKGLKWVLENMLNPVVEGTKKLLPGGLMGEIAKGVLDKIWHAIRDKIDEAEKAQAMIDVGGGGGGGANQWAATASEALRIRGLPSSWLNSILTIIQRESGGNPNAVNRTDSNAARGTPSMGLMQTIGPTFEAHKYPGYNNILAPLDNILAALGYIVARYGTIFRVQQGNPNLPARGYDGGGMWPSGTAGFNFSGGTEMVLNPSQASAFEDRIRGGNGDHYVTVKIGDEIIIDKVRAVVDGSNGLLVQALNRGY